MNIKTFILHSVLKNILRLNKREPFSEKLRLLSLSCVFLSVACSYSSPEKAPHLQFIDIRVDRDVNLNRYGEPAPVNISIYRMDTPGEINNDMTELQDFRNNKRAEVIFSAVFQPGEIRCLKLPLQPETLAIAVTGEFRDIEHAQSKSVQPLPHTRTLPWWKRLFTTRDNTLYARVHRQGLTLTGTE